MEDNFIKDDFEQFLKGNADEFLMVPQRKVWYSIYNSMHPDRKWPSLAVCLLILSAVLFIGISNNNSISDAARKAGAENLSSIARNRSNDNDNNTNDTNNDNTMYNFVILAIFYPFSQFCEIDVSLPSL